MKKAILTVFLMVLGISIFAQTGIIKELSGTVELKTAGASAFVPANSGDRVNADTVISTGFKSTALVEAGSALIVVRPLTRLTLTEIQASSGTETLNANLQAGRIRVDLTPPAGTKASLTVTSPSATASVRGTSFDMNVMGVHVYSGKVGFGGAYGLMVNVESGASSSVQGNTIQGNGIPTNPLGNKRTQFTPPSPAGNEPVNIPPARAEDPVLYTPDVQPPTVEPPPVGPAPGGGGGGGGGGWGGGSTPPPTTPTPPTPPTNPGTSGGDVGIQISY